MSRLINAVGCAMWPKGHRSKTALSNTETVQGQTAAVFGAKAHTNYYRDQEALDACKPIMAKLGYDGGYVPFMYA